MSVSNMLEASVGRRRQRLDAPTDDTAPCCRPACHCAVPIAAALAASLDAAFSCVTVRAAVRTTRDYLKRFIRLPNVASATNINARNISAMAAPPVTARSSANKIKTTRMLASTRMRKFCAGCAHGQATAGFGVIFSLPEFGELEAIGATTPRPFRQTARP